MKKLLGASSLILLFSVSAYADPDLSEGASAGGCQDVVCPEFSCEDLLSRLTVNFDLDPGTNGAEFEKYQNPNNSAEVGYRSCSDTCSITVAGRCNGVECDECENATVTVTVSATPEPTPAPKCDYYKGTIKSNSKKFDSNFFNTSGNQFKYKNNSGLSCIDGIVNDARSQCGRNYREGNFHAANLVDDCIANILTTKLFSEGNCRTTSDWDYSNAWHFNTKCLDGEVYLDDKCNVVSEDEISELCGDFSTSFNLNFTYSCPISLIWSKGHDINSDIVFSNFNLDLGNVENNWYAWKASAEAPLLVYDPTHSGEVKDATQLFGNWTFGGKQVSSLMSTESNVATGKWDNGYEALSTLDRDFDGKLSGEELNDLALWFDANRDAVSQKGEVKSLKEVGVKTLFFNGYAEDAQGDLRLNVGYEREVNGEILKGESVDWFEVGAESKLALIDYVQSLSSNSDSGLEKKIEDGHELKSVKDSKFDGIWSWYLDEKEAIEGTPNKGTFIFNAVGKNEVKGYTFSQRLFASSPDNKLNSFVTMNRVKGIENGNVLTFAAQVGNSYTKNKAVLSADGKTINGTTTVFIANKKTVSYSWNAVRQ